MADTQEKVAADAAMEVSNQDEEKVPSEVGEENEKPKRGRRSGSKRSSISKIQEEAQDFTKGLPGTEVEGRRMTRSAVRGPPPVTPSPPPKREKKSTGASGGGGRGGKRGRQRKIEKEDEDEEEEEESKAKTPQKTEENGDNDHDHGDDEEDEMNIHKKEDAEKKDEEMEEVEPTNDDKGKPVVNNSEIEPTASASDSSEPKEGTTSEETEKQGHDECQVNNVDSKVAEAEKLAADKAVNENSLSEKQAEAEEEVKSPSEDATPSKVVPQDPEPVPVPVSQ